MSSCKPCSAAKIKINKKLKKKKDSKKVKWAFQVALVVKSPRAKAAEKRNAGSIPGSGRSPGGGHGNPLQYSCLENPVDRGAWWALPRHDRSNLAHVKKKKISTKQMKY